jgi:hypothetical protein
MGSEIKAHGVNWSPTPVLFTITLPKSFVSATASKLTSVATLGELSALYFNNGLLGNSLNIYVNISSKNSTAVVARIYINAAQYVSKLTISTLTYLQDAQYAHTLGAYTFDRDFKAAYSNSFAAYDLYYIPLNPSIEQFGNVDIPIMISGITANPVNTFKYSLDVKVSAVIYNSTTVLVTLSSNFGQYTRLTHTQLVFVIYNEAFANAPSSTYYRLYSGAFRVSSASSTQYTSCLPFSSTNAFVGLNSFTSSYNAFSFYVQVGKSNITVSSDNPFGVNNTFILALLIIESIAS